MLSRPIGHQGLCPAFSRRADQSSQIGIVKTPTLVTSEIMCRPAKRYKRYKCNFRKNFVNFMPN
jgi:hypothetical protein